MVAARAHGSSHVEVSLPARQEPAGINRAEVLRQKLQSIDKKERDHARNELRSLAKESDESREQVIRTLIELVEQSNERSRLTSGVHYDAWSFAVELLGELKATESIDALIACIDCNDGIEGLSLTHHPALKAIITIGPAAIPRLTEALRNAPPETRRYSALALGMISEPEAKAALESALPLEQDNDVLTCIKIALRQHGSPNHL